MDKRKPRWQWWEKWSIMELCWLKFGQIWGTAVDLVLLDLRFCFGIVDWSGLIGILTFEGGFVRIWQFFWTFCQIFFCDNFKCLSSLKIFKIQEKIKRASYLEKTVMCPPEYDNCDKLSQNTIKNKFDDNVSQKIITRRRMNRKTTEKVNNWQWDACKVIDTVIKHQSRDEKIISSSWKNNVEQKYKIWCKKFWMKNKKKVKKVGKLGSNLGLVSKAHFSTNF